MDNVERDLTLLQLQKYIKQVKVIHNTGGIIGTIEEELFNGLY